MLSDFLAAGLEYKLRCRMLARWLEIALELFDDCVGVWIPASGKLLTRQQLLNNPYRGDDRFLYFGVNIRFFNIQGTEDMMVDSLGLYAVGLPDVQYHFHGLDPNDVVDHAYRAVGYLFGHDAPVKPGETIAIMGETGCGKTSLINLIPRFYEPTKGEVRIDDIPVQNFRLSDLRKQIGLATQDVLLYSDTIEGNIAYGDSSIDLEEVEKFAKYSAASDFISKMPEGYDTVVGERGVGLSGGQKQRISLARALAVRPSILILDDTTSAVDMETEKQIQEALRHLDFSCTKVIIAQRISTTMMADQILVMQHGRITEMGNHEELMAKKGYYYELVQLQTGEDLV